MVDNNDEKSDNIRNEIISFPSVTNSNSMKIDRYRWNGWMDG